MQQHMFWALFIHAQDAQDIADDPAKQADVWNDLRDLAAAVPRRARRGSAARPRSGMCRRSSRR